MPNFGRLIPKEWRHIEKYPFRKFGFTAPSVETILPYPWLRVLYNQKNTNGCTGYSATWASSINNFPPTKIYDPLWLYHQGTIIDQDQYTSPEEDTGGYIWAVMEVLRTQGHVLVKRDGTNHEPRPDQGIQSYYWCQTVDEIRTAIGMRRPVVLGINWYEDFMQPAHKSNGYWIGTNENLGFPVGGHAICCYGAKDSLQAFRLLNTWGVVYPNVWIPYTTVEKLQNEYGEACVPMDL